MPEGNRPNILFIMTDQLRRDALGVYGSWAPTPHLDELASESVVFDNAVTNSPACKPARFSLALGHYPHNHGLWSNAPGRVPDGAPTWTNDLRTAGYRTSVFGKLHLSGGKRAQKERQAASLGFDVVNEAVGPRGCMMSDSLMTDAWAEAGVLDLYRHDLALRLTQDSFVARPSPLPLDLYCDVWIPSQAKEHIEALPSDRPWFCMVSFTGPHEPWDAPEPYASMFSPDDAPGPLPMPDRLERGAPSSLDDQPRLAAGLSERTIRELRANYAGSVNLIDHQVGGLIDAVKRRGEWENTAVIFTSDHGEMNGDHGLFYKNNFLDGAVSIPLMVRDPSRTGGERSPAPAELFDVGATALHLAGLEPSHETFARSLVGDHPPRDIAVSEFLGDYMVIDGRHKLVVNHHGDDALLFDHGENRNEATNLIDEARYAPVVADLRDRLLRHLARTQLGHRSQGRPGGYAAQVAAAAALLEADPVTSP